MIPGINFAFTNHFIQSAKQFSAVALDAGDCLCEEASVDIDFFHFCFSKDNKGITRLKSDNVFFQNVVDNEDPRELK